MRLEIITHCYRYSRVLTYQLSSLVLNPPPFEVSCTIFYNEDDKPTSEVLDYFQSLHHDRFSILCWPLSKEELMRREIGRNTAASLSLADLVWFADADYVFGPGCLAALEEYHFEDDVIYHPQEVQINTTHAFGDQYARMVTKPETIDIDPEDFMPKRHNFAIGGLQIVTGNTARKHGYCPDDKKLQSPADTWQDTKGDFRYRKIIQAAREESGRPPLDGKLVLPNLYRIRQTVAGEVDTLPVSPGSPGSSGS